MDLDRRRLRAFSRSQVAEAISDFHDRAALLLFFRMSRSSAGSYLLVGMLATAGCSSQQPTAPTSQVQTSTSTAGPTATFSLSVDSLDSREALAAVSEITVDATASTGAGLRYRIDFGDGTTATEPVARHIYVHPGTYEVTVAVSDDSNRSATAARDLVVTSTVGTWVHAGYLASIGRVEARSLTIRTQDANAVSGTLTKDGVPAAFTGSIRRDRQIRLNLDGTSEVLEGVIPSTLSADGVEWPLSLQGRSARAESLVFKRVVGEPAGPGPDADLGMRFFSFSAPYAIKQISPVLFDGSASRGKGLSYFIEFGDGQVAKTSTATHPLEHVGTYQARLTVVDRFGRSDSESLSYRVYSLMNRDWNWLGHTDRCESCVATVSILTQQGMAVSGILGEVDWARGGGEWSNARFQGTITADGKVRLVLEGSNVTLDGSLVLWESISSGGRLTLTYHGGRRDGATLSMSQVDTF